jgi:hypothetical protein
MPSHFKTIGPFELGKTSESIEADHLKRFWSDTTQKNHAGLPDAIGVYLIAIGSKSALQPIYVGKAEHGFRARLNPAHDAFRKARNKYKDETLSLLLIARVTPTRGKFLRKRKEGKTLKSINDLEVLLIRDCLTKGFDLINSKEKQFFQDLVVPGYLHDENSEATDGANCLRSIFQTDSRKKK